MPSLSTIASRELVLTLTEEVLSDALGAALSKGSDDDSIRFDPWIEDLGYRGGGNEYRDLLAEFRRFMNVLAMTAPSAEVMDQVSRGLKELREALSHHGAKDGEVFSGNRYDLPGRGHPHLIPARITRWSTNELHAVVVFGGAHMGGNGAVHGGMQPLLFDELLGRLSNTNRPTRCRTAYLKTDYLRVTLPNVPYDFDATVDREEGRKRFLSARLTAPDGQVVATAEGLFVALNEGAP